MHELPDPSVEILVVPGPDAEATLAFLCARKRTCRIAAPDAGPAGGLRLWSPNPWLETLSLAGSILDVGCGTGRNAVHLADLGLQVTAFDRLPDAVERGRVLERRYHQGEPKIKWVRASYATFETEKPFDAMVCLMSIPYPLAIHARKWLREGGLVVAQSYSQAHRASTGKPKDERLVLRRDDVEGLHIESWEEDAHYARLIARL
ncbi:MAG: methyltransferase domain-containing protein [Armatimonadetes bacterium]|nr:methyltransferase domain-containing protein [Armatimonadota bacterium]